MFSAQAKRREIDSRGRPQRVGLALLRIGAVGQDAPLNA
jgi:hypothetical protein